MVTVRREGDQLRGARLRQCYIIQCSFMQVITTNCWECWCFFQHQPQNSVTKWICLFLHIFCISAFFFTLKNNHNPKDADINCPNKKYPKLRQVLWKRGQSIWSNKLWHTCIKRQTKRVKFNRASFFTIRLLHDHMIWAGLTRLSRK